MKSEERHRLQETELEKLGKHARDYWETFAQKYGKTVFIGTGVVCLIAAIAIWWTISSSTAKDERWTAMLAANSAEDFAAVANKFSNQPVGQWARLKEAEQSLLTGIDLAVVDRQGSVSELVVAQEAFTQLAGTQSELIEERRLFGLARCLETLAGVDVGEAGENVEGVEKAIEAYQRFVDQFGESIYRPYAEERIQALKTERAQEFYAWFREQNPNPEDFKLPEDGSPLSGAPGTPGAMPPGHPGIQPPQLPSAPPVTEEAVVDELESIVKEAHGITQQQAPPSETEKPDGGPALTPPKSEDNGKSDAGTAPAPPKADAGDKKTEEAPASPPSEENTTPE